MSLVNSLRRTSVSGGNGASWVDPALITHIHDIQGAAHISPKNGQAVSNVLGIVTAVLVYVAGWIFVHYTPVGGDDNHVLAIGVGGGMGILMLFNVWGIIWPNNKKVIRGTLAGRCASPKSGAESAPIVSPQRNVRRLIIR